jgi:diacylglycerol kinase (ATP)
MTAAKYRHIVVFLNPASGTLDPDLRSQVRDRLTAISDSLEEVTVNPDVKLLDRAAEAVREGATLIVVAGGDGTVREVASALVGTEVPLAIVPLGTFNNLALSLNLPCNPQAVCDLIEAGLYQEH